MHGTDIIDRALKHTRFNRTFLISRNRSGNIVPFRLVLMLILFDHTNLGHSGIGRLLKRHHATVMYGVENARDRIDTPGYEEYTKLYNRIMNDIGPNFSKAAVAKIMEAVDAAKLMAPGPKKKEVLTSLLQTKNIINSIKVQL